MDTKERLIIKSKRYNIRNIFWIIFGVAGMLAGILYLLTVQTEIDHHREFCSQQYWGTKNPWDCGLCYVDFNFWIYVFMPFWTIILFGTIFCLILKSMEIVVTDKRVYGKTYFGKTIDLPIDSVSAVGSKWMKGISVATSSGKISFLLIKNAKEIHEEIRKLLISRQEEKRTQSKTEQAVATVSSDFESLKKLQELLNEGIITQEEFETKKKQILGL